MNSASLCSLAGRYANPIPPSFLARIDFLKIPAQSSTKQCCELLSKYNGQTGKKLLLLKKSSALVLSKEDQF
jgi:hypothetical protein